MIAAARSELASVLQQTRPESRAGAFAHGMGSDPHDAWAGAATGALFAVVAEEIDTAARLHHPAGAVGHSFQNLVDPVTETGSIYRNRRT